MAEQTAEVYREMGEQMKQNMPPGQAPPIDPFTQMGNVMWVICVGMAIGMVVLGVIYPAIVLWALTRSGTKAACR